MTMPVSYNIISVLYTHSNNSVILGYILNQQNQNCKDQKFRSEIGQCSFYMKLHITYLYIHTYYMWYPGTMNVHDYMYVLHVLVVMSCMYMYVHICTTRSLQSTVCSRRVCVTCTFYVCHMYMYVCTHVICMYVMYREHCPISEGNFWSL